MWGLSPGSGCRGENLLEGIALPPWECGASTGAGGRLGRQGPKMGGGAVCAGPKLVPGPSPSACSTQGSLVFPLGWDLGAPLGGLGVQEAWQGFRGASEGSPDTVPDSGLLLP